MSHVYPQRVGLFGVLCVLLVALSAPAEPKPLPSDSEVKELLAREPMTLKTWPAWRGRLLDWIGDRGRQTDAAWEAGRAFVSAQATDDQLPPTLADDAFAWYLFGSALLNGNETAHVQIDPVRAERLFRKSLTLDAKFSRAHRNLALAILAQAEVGKPTPAPQEAEAQRHLDEARRLDPALPLDGVRAMAAFRGKRFAEAEQLFRKAGTSEPQEAENAVGLAASMIFNKDHRGPRVPEMKSLAEKFPDNGRLICLYGMALGMEENPREAVRQFQHARELGTDPATTLAPEVVKAIEDAAAPPWYEQLAWIMGIFAGSYAGIMILMALSGLVLASMTRGPKALQLLGVQSDEIITEGQVLRTRHESTLTTLYGLALLAGLVLFYVSIPFIVVGVLAVTGILLYATLMLGRVPIKLVVIIVVVGGMMAWGVLRSLFTKAGSGGFGIKKGEEDCPKLYQALREVAGRVDTNPVDEVYLGPGASIGVHQEGRGPFGMFGVKRRVLTLGLSTLHFLTIGELKAILAHEYAHFSHKDTFYSRFIYQVTMSIEAALNSMGSAAGWFNYVNPFYWFLYLYYRAYTLLSAGYSRSREYLADRMAASLYGSEVFISALTKVATDGTLFEMTMYGNVQELLNQEKAYSNLYEAFRELRNEGLPAESREELYQKILNEKESLFATHPTYGERVAALEALPKVTSREETPAMDLFEKPEEIEKELTEFLTAYLTYIRHLQALAAAQQQQ